MMVMIQTVALMLAFCFTSSLAIESRDVYRILNRRFVWEVIDDWERPDGTVTHMFPQGNGLFHLYLWRMEVPSVEAKFINDTERGYTIYSIRYTERQILRPSGVDLIHQGHRISVAADSCGRGVCFIQERDGLTTTAILVQNNTMLGEDYTDLSVSIYLTASHHEHVIVQLHPPVESGGPPRLMNYIMSPYDHDILRADNYSPSYTVTYNQDGIEVRQEKARIDTQIHRSDNEPFPPQMSFDYFAGPGKYKTTKSNGTAINGSDVIYSEEVDFNDPVFNDSILTSNILLTTSRDRNPHDLAVYVRLEKVYFILPEDQVLPTVVKEQWILCNAAPDFVEVGEIFVLGCTVFHELPVTVSWMKLNGGEFEAIEGFVINKSEFYYYTSSSVTNYVTRPEDAGLYQFRVYRRGASEILRATNFTISVRNGEGDSI